MKKVFIALLILLALAGGALYWAYERLDLIVKLTLERYGPDVTGVTIRVGDVEISPQNGRGSLKSVEIGNPHGFTASHALRLGEVRLVIDPATIRAPVVHIREIAIDSPAIVYERGVKNTNLDVIQKNIESYVARSNTAAESSGVELPVVGRHHKFIFDRISIRRGKVTMTNPALRGQGVTFDLPDIEIRDLGKREGGLTPSQAANVVASTLTSKIAQKVLTNFDLLRKGGVEGAIDALKGLIR